MFNWATRIFAGSNASPPLVETAASSIPTTPSELRDRSALPTRAPPTNVTDHGHREARAPSVSTPMNGQATPTHDEPSMVEPPDQSGSCQPDQPDPWEVTNGFASKEEGKQYVTAWSAANGFVCNISSSKVNITVNIYVANSDT
jgi:hypothetical protein